MYVNVEGVPNTAGSLTVTWNGHVWAMCSVTRDPIVAEVTVTYVAKDMLLEVMSFEKWCKELVWDTLNAEDLLRLIYSAVRRVIGDTKLVVTGKVFSPNHNNLTIAITEDQEQEDEDVEP